MVQEDISNGFAFGKKHSLAKKGFLLSFAGVGLTYNIYTNDFEDCQVPVQSSLGVIVNSFNNSKRDESGEISREMVCKSESFLGPQGCNLLADVNYHGKNVIKKGISYLPASLDLLFGGIALFGLNGARNELKDIFKKNTTYNYNYFSKTDFGIGAGGNLAIGAAIPFAIYVAGCLYSGENDFTAVDHPNYCDVTLSENYSVDD